MIKIEEIVVPSVLIPEFVSAIEDYIKNPNTITNCRNCRALNMNKASIDNFLFSQIDGFVPIIAQGGGWVKWNLCRYKSNLYFVFIGSSLGEKIITSRATDLDEVIQHLRNVDNRGGVKIDSEIIPYDQVYNKDIDFGSLDFKTSMARIS